MMYYYYQFVSIVIIIIISIIIISSSMIDCTICSVERGNAAGEVRADPGRAIYVCTTEPSAHLSLSLSLSFYLSFSLSLSLSLCIIAQWSDTRSCLRMGLGSIPASANH